MFIINVMSAFNERKGDIDMSEKLYEGKSKAVYKGEDDNSYVIKFKDTATAFNGVKKEELSGKGVLNAAISNKIYAYLKENGIKTHLLAVEDEVTNIVRKAEIIMVEVIVRNVAAGSFSRKYGVAEGTALNNEIYEFSLKSDELDDPMINDLQVTAIGIATQEELDYMRNEAKKINKLLSELFVKMGIKLVDFKLEFGRSTDGIILCDEISPDSCRLWDLETMEKLDKDRFRRDLGDVLDGYRDVLGRLEDVL